MMLRTPLLLLAIAVAAACTAQDGVITGTTLTVDPGTTLRIEGAQTVNVQNGATVVNNGTIVFGTTAAVAEDPNAPISGSGTETTTHSYTTPLSGIYPAGLGLEISTAVAPGTLTLTRGHLHFTDNGGMQGVDRWFDVDAAVNTGLDVDAVFHYNLSQLNGANEASLTLHTRAPFNYWDSSASTVNMVAGTVSVSSLDSLGTITLFDGISTGVDEPAPAAYNIADHGDGSFMITTTSGAVIGQLIVCDALGREVLLFNAPSPGYAIDLGAFASGVYTIKAAGWRQKLVKR